MEISNDQKGKVGKSKYVLSRFKDVLVKFKNWSNKETTKKAKSQFYKQNTDNT